jgi:hypothetical protein
MKQITTSLESDQKTGNKLKNVFILPYLINLMILLSTGFIAGAVVHVGFNNSNNVYYLMFGVLGCILFVSGNFLQEKIIQKTP